MNFFRVGLLWIFAVGVLSAEVHFVSERLSLRAGETAMLAIRSDAEAMEDTELACELGGEAVVELLQAPKILSGETMGFLRIRATRAGEATLKVGGKELKLEVTSEALTALAERMRPEITSPSHAAALWGKVAVGAEIWVGAPGQDRSRKPEARLILENGQELEPVEVLPPVDGPFWRILFELDCAELPAGGQNLRVIYHPHLQGKPEGFQLESDHLWVNVVASEDPTLWRLQGECEQHLDAPRSRHLGKEPPGIGHGPMASGARFVNLWGYRPEWAFEAEVPRKAQYQLMVRAKGTLAASAYPSIEMLGAENGRRISTARLASTQWHRIPLGPPVTLEAGKQVLAVRLANDINYRNRLSRDAYLDRFELLEIKTSEADGGDAMAMMAGGMAMMDQEQAGAESGKSDKIKAARQLRVAFTEWIDGQRVNGSFQVHSATGVKNYRNNNDYRPIKTALLINGRVFETQVGRYSNFTVYPHQLQLGENRLQLIAVGPKGAQAKSMVQTVMVDAKSHPSSPLKTQFNEDRYLLNRGKVSRAKPKKMADNDPLRSQNGPDMMVSLGQGDGSSELLVHEIPQHLSGERRISLLLRGSADAAMPRCALELKLVVGGKNKREIPLGIVQPTDDWQWQALKRINLPKGKKNLVISAKWEGDDPCFTAVGGYSLGAPYFVDETAPEVALLYPSPGASLHGAGDALVVRAFDDRKIRHFYLKVDGERYGLAHPARGLGLNLLPFDTTMLEPGEHRIQVIVVDGSGKESGTDEIQVTLTKALDSKLLQLAYPRAVRLAERLGFGADRRALMTILTEGEQAWIEQQVSADLSGTDEALIEELTAIHFSNLGNYQVRGRVISQALLTPHPVRARFVLWAQNHFSVWMGKTGSKAKWKEHQGFAGAGLARFSDLLLSSATSPAMMVFLDQQNSIGKQRNENYAREILELHTVGVGGGYDQKDVTALSHLLTGWGAQREATMEGNDYLYRYRFSPILNEGQSIRCYGLEVPAVGTSLQGDDRILQFLEMLAGRPETARFVTRKLAKHYLVDPSEELLTELESCFLETQGDFRALIRVIATSDDLMRRELEPKLLKPVEFGIVSQRRAGFFHPWRIIDLGDRCGRNLFDRSSPDGYPEENAEYAGSNFQLQKWRFAKDLESNFGDQLNWSWFEQAQLKHEIHRRQVLANSALILLGRPLSSSSMNAAAKVMEQAASIKDHNQRRRLIGSFIEMLPESQSR